ncbi:hypothetical protein GGF46_001591 [Coemansia sp. RSA 552]|nr:hypothetical protein GGF46_001591 [Coemansia sp. RSA 552]
MAPLTPSKLKVVELKKELTARGLATSGLKSDLIKRLEEALSNNDSPSGPEAKDEEDEDRLELLPAEEQAALDNTEGVAEASMEQAEDENTVPNAETNDGMDVEPAEHSQEPEVSEEGGKGDGSDHSLQGADEPVPAEMQVDSVQAEDTSRDSENSMYIKNLERPLTIFRMKEMLGKYGTINDIWLNSIKTRAYVSFATRQQAEAAYAGTNGARFPPDHGRILECGYITLDRMKALIGDEELMSEDVHNTDLAPVPVENGNCGVALSKVGGKSAAKRQKTEDRKRADKGPAQATSLIIAAASASANDARGAARDKCDGQRPASPEPRRRAEQRDPRIRLTAAHPPISYRPLTDEEVAAKRGVPPGGSA